MHSLGIERVILIHQENKSVSRLPYCDNCANRERQVERGYIEEGNEVKDRSMIRKEIEILETVE